MSAFKRIIASSLVIATIFANIVSAAAGVSSDSGVKVGWWTNLLHNLAQRSDGLSIMEVPYGSWICSIVADMSGTVCEFSEDHWHHADESDYLKVSEGDDGTYAVRAKCKYCHKEFVATGLTAADLSDKYSNYVSSLPASGYNSAGALLWQPRWIEDCPDFAMWVQIRGSWAVYPTIENYYQNVKYADTSYSGSAFTFTAVSGLVDDDFGTAISWRKHAFTAPITGRYLCVSSPAISGTISQKSSDVLTYDVDYSVKDCGVYSAGASIAVKDVAPRTGVNGGYPVYSTGLGISGTIVLTTPVYSITPTDSTIINNNYTINTRVNNFNGDYYDSVTNNTYNNTTIVNETTNNYYDFITDTKYPMESWSYDYVSRTYFITLEDGTTVTVQFGDDCLTITNNNVSNSYQYVIKNNGGSDTPSACKHDWKETIDLEPTCLEGGHASYTCSLCGETYEQLLAAKGHDWKVKEHVNTVYGENGEVVTQGHTLYECAVCGEQWYTDTASPPPGTSGGNILAWLESFKSWLGDKLDNLFHGDTNNFWDSNKKTFTDMLSSLLQTLLDFLTNILEKLLGLITDLLSFFFDLLSSTVIAGISAFFSALKDAQLFSFFQKDDSSEVALPDGIATVFAFFSGVILALPVELRSLLLLGTAIVVLIGVINIIKS